jgi:hypothetical protein
MLKDLARACIVASAYVLTNVSDAPSIEPAIYPEKYPQKYSFEPTLTLKGVRMDFPNIDESYLINHGLYLFPMPFMKESDWEVLFENNEALYRILGAVDRDQDGNISLSDGNKIRKDSGVQNDIIDLINGFYPEDSPRLERCEE